MGWTATRVSKWWECAIWEWRGRKELSKSEHKANISWDVALGGYQSLTEEAVWAVWWDIQENSETDDFLQGPFDEK